MTVCSQLLVLKNVRGQAQWLPQRTTQRHLRRDLARRATLRLSPEADALSYAIIPDG